MRGGTALQKLRLFWAVNLPDSVKAELGKLVEKLRISNADAKWVEEHNLHLTLQFLGEVERHRIPDINAAVKAAVSHLEPFCLSLGGLGAFPNFNRPRVLWVGLGGELDKITDLHSRVSQALTTIGFAPEERPFRPHLTLTRFRSPIGVEPLMQGVRQLRPQVQELGHFHVKSVDLMQSQLSNKGPKYNIVSGIVLADRGLV